MAVALLTSNIRVVSVYVTLLASRDRVTPQRCTRQFTSADAAVTPARVMTGLDAASRPAILTGGSARVLKFQHSAAAGGVRWGRSWAAADSLARLRAAALAVSLARKCCLRRATCPAIITLGSTRVLVCHHSAAARGVRQGWCLAARYPGAALGALPACCTRALLVAVTGTVTAVVITARVHVAASAVPAAPAASATACAISSVRCACTMCTARRFVTSCSLLALFAAVASVARALQWIGGICATLSVFTAPELLACFARAQVLTTVKTDLRTKPIVTTALCSSITSAMTVARIFDDPPTPRPCRRRLSQLSAR